MDYLSDRFNRWLNICIGVLTAISVAIYFLHEKVFSVVWGVDIIWFQYFTMACGFTLCGFYSLRGYKRNINKGTNFAMMLVFFVGGGSCILLSIWRIVVEISHRNVIR